MAEDSRLPLVPGYQLLGKIAESGGSVVYRARHPHEQRLVALKLFSDDSGWGRSRQSFRAEVTVLASLCHPNIVSIYEVGEWEGRPYFAMPLIEGDSLARQLPSFVRDECAAAWLLARVARAVEHVHQRGFLHRDLTPEHILLDPSGEPYLIGFGLARPLGPGAGELPVGMVVGNARCMSPEQVTGARDLTPASDVFGLGVILYELLTGRLPFRGATLLETLLQTVGREPDRLGALNPDVDPELESVCLKCLEKEPGRRYGSAAALADDLERWLQGE